MACRPAAAASCRALRSIALVIALTACVVQAGESTHKYQDGEEVTVWVNKVGPYHNPQESYTYYSLPFCRPEAVKPTRKKSHSLGEVLEGNELVDSGIHVQFKRNQLQTRLCDVSFTPRTEKRFHRAIKHHYWFQMYIDELPMWGMVGQMLVADQLSTNKQAFVYTHKSFSIAYNGDRIIEVNLTSENPKPVVAGTSQPFTYSVVWVPTAKPFEDRFDRYLDFSFFEHQIHWFSIFNSMMMVMFLCGIVVLILMKTLKNDYLRYQHEDDEELSIDHVIDESGWKQVHLDVFRAPPNLMLLSACLGTGFQLVVLVFTSILFAIAGELYRVRGANLSTFLVLFSLTSFLSGFYSGYFFKKHGGVKWKHCMVLTALLFPGVCGGIHFMLNFVAVGYGSSAAISIGTMLTVLAIWLFINVPILTLGTIVGRNSTKKGDFPCSISSIRRPIPDGKWYTNPIVLSVAGGVLPFGSIFIEMYFVFTSFWNYKFYYVYGFMLLVYIILAIVTMCVTIVSTYAMLNAEDYRWQWTCFLGGGSTAAYVYAYSVYYFYSKTKMFGFFQIAFYFGYMLIFCIGLFLLCGTIGFLGTNLFVHQIYTLIKSD